MRILHIAERTVPLSRYADPSIPSGSLDTSAVAIRTDQTRAGRPVIGYGFASIGRFAQGGLIRERFAPRLLAASADELSSAGRFDPCAAWDRMMADEKPGGHGERCVAVGALDMALWDIAGKLEDLPLHALLRRRFAPDTPPAPVPTYLGGGYPFPVDDIMHLEEEVRWALDFGFTRVKIKIGSLPLAQDLARIEAVLALLPGGEHLAVDAMNRYSPTQALEAAAAFEPYHLAWFEDFCDPLDFETHARMTAAYPHPVAAGEALFSTIDATNVIRHGELRPDRDILLFDPAHCYGFTEYARLVATVIRLGWPRSSFWPHGGHLFGLQVACGLGLGGAELNARNFQPFGGFQEPLKLLAGGLAIPPDLPGIGWESRPTLHALFTSLGDT